MALAVPLSRAERLVPVWLSFGVRLMKSAAVIVAILLVPLPIAAASYPRVGGFISRPGRRRQMLAAGVVLGLVGLIASAMQLVPFKAGFYFWSPLWQVVVVQVSYLVWFRFFKRPPVNVVFNWDMDIVADRILAMAIGLLGILAPVFAIGR